MRREEVGKKRKGEREEGEGGMARRSEGGNGSCGVEK